MFNDTDNGQTQYCPMCLEWAEENKKLKAENERLSELTCVNCGEKFLSPTGSELYEKIVQLKAENDGLKSQLDFEIQKRETVEAENEELKKELELNTANAVVIEMAERLNKLKQALEEVRDCINVLSTADNNFKGSMVEWKINKILNEVLKDKC